MNLRDLHTGQRVSQYLRGGIRQRTSLSAQHTMPRWNRRPARPAVIPWATVGFEQRFGSGEDPNEVALMLPEREVWLEKSFFDDDDKGVTFTESRVDGTWQEGESFR